jgi:hypothetical protein
MPSSESNSVSAFERECLAAKNRLGEIAVREISTEEITQNGKTLYADDLRVLAIVVEEQNSLDPTLGLYIDGVSRSTVREIMEYKNIQSVKHRFDNLEEAGLIEQPKADALPKMPKGGYSPRYAVPTRRGKEIVEELELLPILTRDRDLELVIDQLLSTVAKMHEDLILTTGRQAALLRELDHTDLDISMGEYDFTEYGLRLVSVAEDPAFLESREDDLLLGEMDAAQRELLIQKLLDEDEDGDDTE